MKAGRGTAYGILARNISLAIALGAAGCAATQNAVDASVPYGQQGTQVKSVSAGGVSLAQIEGFLRKKSYELRATRPGVWRISVDGVLVLLVAEDSRIRFLAPIFALHQLDAEPTVRSALMIRLLQSNFERSIDARYAIFDGIVFATVTHPRTTLAIRDIDYFLLQVVNLHKNTFRTGRNGYSSDAPEPDSQEIDPRLDETLKHPDSDAASNEPVEPEPAAPVNKKSDRSYL